MSIRKAAVIGGGAMGGGIAHLLSNAGIECFVKDIDLQFVDKALDLSAKIYSKLVDRGKLDAAEAEAKQALLRGGTEYDLAYFAQVDLVIEAVPEIMALKQGVFAELEKICPGTAILATNTSTLSLSEIGAKLADKSRFVGLHFFNPAHVMKLVEVIYDQNSAESCVDTMMDFARTIGKVPIRVKNGPGFVVNRILIPYMNEAVLALMSGAATMQEIDSSMVDFGMPMGPFVLWDLVGLDVGLHASKTLADAYGDRTPIPELLQYLNDKGCLGQKSGKGFYDYSGDRPCMSDEAAEFLATHRGESSRSYKPEQLLMVQIREALLIVEEGISSAADADIGMVYGTNFPKAVAKGPLDYAEQVMGWAEVSQSIDVLQSEWGSSRFYLPQAAQKLVDGSSVFNK